MIRDEGSVYYAAVPLATAMLLTPFQARNGEWFKEVSVIGCPVGFLSELTPAQIERYSAGGIVAMQGRRAHAGPIYVLGEVTSLGLIEGEHSCRPATEEETRTTRNR